MSPPPPPPPLAGSEVLGRFLFLSGVFPLSRVLGGGVVGGLRSSSFWAPPDAGAGGGLGDDELEDKVGGWELTSSGAGGELGDDELEDEVGGWSSSSSSRAPPPPEAGSEGEMSML